MQSIEARNAYTSYFRFNNERTLSTNQPSELSIIEENGCSVFIDKTRRYDNQMIIRDQYGLDSLDNHLKLYEGYSPEIGVEPLGDSPELRAWLDDNGFKPIYELQFLELRSSEPVMVDKPESSISVERWGQDKVDDFLELIKTSGLECASELWAKKRAFYCTDTFRCYVAKINSQPRAWATSFIEGKYAILANAFTQEDYRGRGCQKALLKARIVDAKSLGVEVFMTDVESESISARNCQSVGFSIVGTRKVWGKG